MTKPSHKKEETLLHTIAQAPTQSKHPVAHQEAKPVAPPLPAKAKAALKPPRKTSQLYFHPEDRKLIRELSAWFAGQGVRINDTLVIRSVLRAVERNAKLLAAYREASLLDHRFKNPLAAEEQ